MIYSDFKGKKLSSLGMGCMRLPRTSDNDGDIDVEKTREMVSYAMRKGINYYDTAWGYHNENSELVMGEILKDYPRESFYLATKFPGFSQENMERPWEIFNRQLEKCQVEHFDFYLLHCVCESNIDMYLDPKYEIHNFLTELKAQGKIHHIGFSVHASYDTTRRFLNAYKDIMEFCQIQLNWLDWDFQSADKKVELVTSMGIPVWVMEPVRGGSLVKLEAEYEEKLRALRPEATNAEWAFRFVQSIPQVKVTLSGMSDFGQLKENIETFEQAKPLFKEEMDTLFSIAKDMTSKKTLPCTKCRYCTSYCPRELDIPWLIELYNEHNYSDGGFIAPMAMDALGDGKKPSDCIGCRACEAVCPQAIKISEMMSDFSEKLAK